MLRPWTHQIEIDASSKAILHIVIQSNEAKNMLVKVYRWNKAKDSFYYELSPNQGSNDELSYAWLIEDQGTYIVEIEHYSGLSTVDSCSYFNLMLGIFSIESLTKQMKCTN